MSNPLDTGFARDHLVYMIYKRGNAGQKNKSDNAG